VQQIASWIETLSISDHVQKYQLHVKVQQRANRCQPLKMQFI